MPQRGKSLIIRASMALRITLSLLALDPRVATASSTGDRDLSPPRSCEQPTNSTAVPAPKAAADMTSLMHSWLAEKKAIFQMEAWWRERSRGPDALVRPPARPATAEAISEME